MRIDGKAIAENILNELSLEVSELKKKDVVPTLAVILIGDDPGSLSYIKQKQKAGERIGARVIFDHQHSLKSPKELKVLIEKYNTDPSVHGLIIQRPVPNELGDVISLLNAVKPGKDVDGFVPHSPFDVPVAAAIITILDSLGMQGTSLHSWKGKNIVIIGRGETAGKPINDLLQKYGCSTTVVHSQTPNPKEILQNADIIISCVGKPNVVTKEMIKSGAILISVGLWRDNDGKLHGDYEEDDIKDTASFYTPTPGGVGPVNVACLMQNLIKSCTISTGGTS